MADFDFWKVLIACIGFGAGGETLRRYRNFKQRRRSTPYNERNSGFWTDRRLFQAEGLFSALTLAIPFCAIVPLLAMDRADWWLYTYPALIAYALLIYLLMHGMNMDEPQ